MQFEMTKQADGKVNTSPIGELPMRIPVQLDNEAQAVHWLQKLGAKLIDESRRTAGDLVSGLYEVPYQTRPEVEVIADPLAWQEKIDHAQAPINMRGSARFWKTVEARGIPVVCRNGVPDFSEIVFFLGGNIGLELSTEAEDDDSLAPFIRYRFVEVADDTEEEE